VQAALEHFGTVDILINNAGILKDKSFLNMSPEEFDEVVQVHLMGTVYTTRAAFAVMKARACGRIVMTTSVAGLYGNFGQTNYSAAKLGVVGFMNALKLEGRKYNIIVNTVAPLAATQLAIATGVFPAQITPFLKPEMVAPAVAYLCSDACETSGAVIAAGGGYFANVQIVEGPGVRFDPAAEVTPETIAENYGAILNMQGAVAFESTGDELQKALGPLMNLQPRE
jgi:NAD(P)-dependent dehydrogenase (short-subunit alcohol dehydrogenase family)